MNDSTKGTTMHMSRPGDLVQAVKGDRRVIDRIVSGEGSPIFKDGLYLGTPTIFGLSSLTAFRNAGYIITSVIEPPAAESTTMQDPEWVQENDWTRAQRGETVRLTNDDGAEATIVIHDRRDPRVPTMSPPWVTSASGFEYVSTLWQLFVQAPPTVALPTVPGTVIRAKGDGLVAMLSYTGIGWFCVKQATQMTDNEIRKNFKDGFDVLEPVAETVKKILDRVLGMALGGAKPLAIVDYLRDEFGVTS